MRRRLAGAMAALAVAVTLGFGLAERPLYSDNQIFFFLAERAADGVPPHVSMADPKTQLSTLVSAAAIRLGEAVGSGDVAAFRAVSVASVAVSVATMVLLGEALAGSLLAGVLAAALLFVVEGLFIEGAGGGRPHVFVVTGVLAAHLLHARRRPFAAGIAGAAALLCWQPSAIALGSIGLAALLSRRAPLREAAAIGAGAATSFFAYEAYFVAHGVLALQLDQEFVMPLASVHRMAEVGESLWFVLTDSRSWLERPRVLPVLAVLVAAAGWLALVAATLRARTRATAWVLMRERPELVAPVLASHLAFAFTVYEHQAHPDLLLVQPYFALGVGAALAAAVTALGRRAGSRRRLVEVAAAALTLILCAGDAWQVAIAKRATPLTLADQIRTAELTTFYTDHRPGLWVLGDVHLLSFLGLDNWVGYGFFWDDLEARMDTREYRPLRDGRMPGVIVAGRRLLPGRSGWLFREYLEVKPPLFAEQGVRVFVRRDAPRLDWHRRQPMRVVRPSQ